MDRVVVVVYCNRLFYCRACTVMYHVIVVFMYCGGPYYCCVL